MGPPRLGGVSAGSDDTCIITKRADAQRRAQRSRRGMASATAAESACAARSGTVRTRARPRGTRVRVCVGGLRTVVALNTNAAFDAPRSVVCGVAHALHA